jgi:hypothetical protein
MNNLDRFKDELARQSGLLTKTEAHSKGVCVNCRQPAYNNCTTDLGRKEYEISGMCEKCFDNLFKGDE